MSDMYVVKKSGPRMAPCGRPCSMEIVEEV